MANPARVAVGLLRGAGVLLAVLALGASPARARDAPSPARVAADVARQGAGATLATLEKAGQLDAVLDRIARGQDAWVMLAPALASSADGAAAEGLGIALADALPRNPRTVLGVLDPANGPVIGADRVCSLPFIERSASALRDYKRRALQAVSAVQAFNLVSARGACLAVLRKA